MTPTFYAIIDSRGNPTLKARLGHHSVAVPSGASTGQHEALELRDGKTPWDGKGVDKALQNARELAALVDWDRADFAAADEKLLSHDGTPNKSRMGANAILAVSMLQAAVQAAQSQEPLWKLLERASGSEAALPLPFANIINGGRHAGNALMLQEFMIVPHKAPTFREATRQVAETVHALKAIIEERYGKSQTAVGDEGGFAPDIATPEEALDLLVAAMGKSGHDLAFAIDAAASEFMTPNGYEYQKGEHLSAEELAERYIQLVKDYPIISLEDPFAEDDFESFARLKRRIAEEGLHCQVVGDDLTVTNTQRIARAIEEDAADCLLLKINQIGTITQSIAAATAARKAGWNVMVSHRSGETEDSFIADLAVGLGTGQIKLGAPVRGERTAKYNRLLEIEDDTGLPLRTPR